MTLLAPWGLAFAALALPVLLLYMLKLRRKEVEVSSTLLWRMLLRDRQANAPWQRLKRNLLLFLQLLILAALVLGLARPAWLVPSVTGGSVVVLLDASASMNTRDIPTTGGAGSGGAFITRFDAARQAIEELATNLPGGATMTLILAGPDAHSLAAAENDPATLRSALAAAQASAGPADWDAAFALAAGAAAAGRPLGAPAPEIVIFSDGGLPAQGLPSLPGVVRYVPVGQSAENLAVSALSLRPSATSAELFASATNYGSDPHQAILSVYRDDRLVHAETLMLPPGESASLVLPGLENLPARFTARLTSPDSAAPNLDPFPLDDAAYTAYQPPKEGRILLVTSGNFFLSEALRSITPTGVNRLLPQDGVFPEIPQTSYDLVVIDGPLTGTLPISASLLLINPTPQSAAGLFPVGAVFTATAPAQVIASPLTRYVDWSTVHVQSARQVELPAWAQSLVQAPGGPLVLAGSSGGRRVAALTFDLHASDLPLQVAFPILLNNLVQYLLGAQPVEIDLPPGGLSPGGRVTLHPLAGIASLRVISPSGRVYPLEAGDDGTVFSDTGELGLYTVAFGEDQVAGLFAANLFSALESDIRPASSLSLARGAVPPSPSNRLGQRELWPWLAGLALALLMLEWWIYHRNQYLNWRTLILSFFPTIGGEKGKD